MLVSISRATVAIGLCGVGLLLLAIRLTGITSSLLLIVGAAVLVAGLVTALRTPRVALLRALGKSALLIGSVTVALLVCEVGARAYFKLKKVDIHDYQPSFVYAYTDERQFDRRRFVSHPFLPYAPRPFDARTLYIDRGRNGQPSRYDYVQNSLGLRSPERSFEKPAKTLRIVTLGGSTTWDGPSNDQTWPALLEKKLNEHYQRSGYRVECVNLAADGFSSPMSLVSLAFTGMEFHPDLVISYDGINDLLVEGYEGLSPDYHTVMGRFDDRFRTLQSRLPNFVFKSYLVSIATRQLDQLRGGNPDVLRQVVLNPRKQLTPSNDPIAGVEYLERNLRLMRAIAADGNAKFLASTSHWVAPEQKQTLQNSRLRDFFRQTQINYLDIDSLLPHNEWSIHVDQVHWTPKGLEMLSDEWAKKIIADDLLGLNARLVSADLAR